MNASLNVCPMEKEKSLCSTRQVEQWKIVAVSWCSVRSWLEFGH